MRSDQEPQANLAIAALARAYREARTTPEQVLHSLYARMEGYADRCIWITPVPLTQALAQARTLRDQDPAALPLYGIPFAIKDNIDLQGIATTAACPAFAFTPSASAPVVARLVAAGAIPIGKTNLDQFATGLVGTRSPYGSARNSFDPQYISGGSSSGSALAVALGLASFALGTDTAGSGRIPAAFNNLVGLKPTCGRLSPRGVVPACRTLDTLSVFALSAEDAARVCLSAQGYDAAEPYSRAVQPARRLRSSAGPFNFGVPRAEQLQFFGNLPYRDCFELAQQRLESLGGQRREIDFAPFLEAAALLYDGPWLAERHLAVETLLRSAPDAILPVTRQIIEAGAHYSATDAFRAQYRLQALRRSLEPLWEQIDVLLTPTAGTMPRIEEVQAEPIRLNAQLGYYTNAVNLLDLAAVAVPAGFTAAGLPFGITLVGPAWSDYDLLWLASRLQRCTSAPVGALGLALEAEPQFDWHALRGGIPVAVCGAHMQGLPLNHQLLDRGAVLLARTRTAAQYRFFALPGGPPYRPGLVRVASEGAAVEIEVWSVPGESFGSFVAGIPAPLAIGKVSLEDGQAVSGFLCESHAIAQARDITGFGGWRAYLASQG
jgi:allophanate hydrolase